MECDSYFSLANISGYSYERELAQTTLCVPNALKAGVFITSIVLFTIEFLIALIALIKDIRKGAQTYRKVYLFSVALACFSEVLATIVFLCGIDHRARFVLTPIFFSSLSFACKELTDAWYEAVTKITAFQQHNTGFYRKFPRMVSYTAWGCAFGWIIVWGVFPIIFVTDPFAMNAVYTTMVCYSALVAAVQTILLYVATVKLLRLYETGAEFRSNSASVDGVVQRLQETKKLFHFFFFPFSVPMFFFPIWLGVTQTETNPGLQGNFYWHFFVYGLGKFFEVTALLYLILRVVRRSGDTGSSGRDYTSENPKRISSAGANKEKEEKTTSFPSYSVEELTVDSSI